MKSLFAITLGLLMQVATAQQFTVQPENSKLSVSGTSTLHDWECVAETFKGNISAKIENDQIVSIDKFNFQFQVEDLKSGKSAMDNKTYDALKEKKHPTITYNGTAVVMNGHSATFSGTMKIAGKEREMVTKVKMNYSNGVIKLSGAKAFNLTDFNMDPPTAVFGTIKTGDEVKIHYNIQLK
ncbi:YceI family protein [Mesonia aestuariivivens]|uniref:YceI family protein n=1 Tax=Mesonia aestuariivivens TaxID=2796128 RepID=A0ABS6W2U8_9FLAO|nr:YceI family protein [Mesonia aestuariivivens]MBW2962139.1 YceI family protein [Mesonia aestuariivivens]